MAKYDSVKEQVASIYRKHLEAEYGDRLIFDDIRVIPRLDQWGDECLYIYVIVAGTAAGNYNVLDPSWINSLYRKVRPQLIELGVTGIPIDSYIDKAEIAPWTDEERARLFR